MNGTTLSLVVVSVVFAAWMEFLARRAAHGRLGNSGPGIRIPAAKVCEHTWRAAQLVAAPRYRKLAVVLVALALAAVLLDVAGVDLTTMVIVWFVGAVGAQVLLLTGAGREAAIAAAAVRCEHQSAPTIERQARNTPGAPRATSRTNARRRHNKRSRGKGGRRR